MGWYKGDKMKFRVVTSNSVYKVEIRGNMFGVSRLASMWGKPVTVDHRHFSTELFLKFGAPMITDEMITSDVVAILPY